MAYGIEAWDDQGNSVITDLQPYNLVGSAFLTSAGNKTLTIAGGSTGTLDYWVEYGVPGGSNVSLVISSVSLSGNIISYTVTDAANLPFTKYGKVHFTLRR